MGQVLEFEGNWYEEFLEQGTVPGWYEVGMAEGKFRRNQEWADRMVAALRAREPLFENDQLGPRLAKLYERAREVEATLWHREQASKQQQRKNDSMVCSPGKIPTVRQTSPQPETPKRLKPRTMRDYIDMVRDYMPQLRDLPTPSPIKFDIGPIRPFPSPTPSPSPSPVKSDITGIQGAGQGPKEGSRKLSSMSVTYTPQEGVLERLEQGGGPNWGRHPRDSMEASAHPMPVHLTYTPQEGVLERLEPERHRTEGNSVSLGVASEAAVGAMELDRDPLLSHSTIHQRNENIEEGSSGTAHPENGGAAPPENDSASHHQPVPNTLKALFEEFGGRLRPDGDPDTGSDLVKQRTALCELGFPSRHSLSTAGSNVDHLDITESIARGSAPTDPSKRFSVSMSNASLASASGYHPSNGDLHSESHDPGFSFSNPGRASEPQESTPSLQHSRGGWQGNSTTPNSTVPSSSDGDGSTPQPCTTSSLGSWRVSPQPGSNTAGNKRTNQIASSGSIDNNQGGMSVSLMGYAAGGLDDDFGGGEPMEDSNLQGKYQENQQMTGGEGSDGGNTGGVVGLDENVSADLGAAENVGGDADRRETITVGTQVSPLFAQNATGKKSATRTKKRGGVVKKMKPVPRTSLCGSDVGLEWTEGDEGKVRRSKRMRMRPLRYWEGETIEYGRDHNTLPTVKGYTMWTPDRQQ